MSDEEKRIEGINAERITTDELQANILEMPGPKLFARLGFIKGLGTFLMGAAMLCLVIIVWVLVNDLDKTRAENACRFDVDEEVNNIADQIDALTAEIFVEAIRNPSRPGEPNPEVVRLGQELEAEIRALRPAIEARQEATEGCHERTP